MKWIVQENFTEKAFGSFIDNLNRMNCDVQLVRLYPFTDKIFPVDVRVDDIEKVEEIALDQTVPSVGIGSIKLNRILDERGFKPGGFRSEEITFESWVDGFGRDNLLNSDSKIVPLGELLNHVVGESQIFLRPLKDDKSFSGTVFEHSFLEQWVVTLMTLAEENSFATVTPDTLVTFSKVRKIFSEYRSFVVDGKVITTSRYKLGNIVLPSDEVAPEVVEFTQRMVDTYQPNRAFVLDVAATPEGFKIIEINGFGSSGFYACDTQKIIMAVEGLNHEEFQKF